MNDEEPTVQVPVSLPTREQIAEVLYSFSGDWQLYRIPWRKQAHDGVRKALLDRADAVITFLLSQPTPAAEPPRIEDLAPGTTFLSTVDQHNTTALRFMRTSTGGAVDQDGTRWPLNAFDPSTIRHVQPPKDTA